MTSIQTVFELLKNSSDAKPRPEFVRKTKMIFLSLSVPESIREKSTPRVRIESLLHTDYRRVESDVRKFFENFTRMWQSKEDATKDLQSKHKMN